MLARLAQNLFWAGRYVERAEDTARMVDVTYHTLLESPQGEEVDAWLELLEVLHLRGAYDADRDGATPADVTRFLVLDEGNQGSILSAVSLARENTRSVRELVSTELWEAVNSFYLELRRRDLGADLASQPYELFAVVKRRCQTITGVAVETMPRDEGWRFFTLGRMLERAEMTSRLLDVRFGQLVSYAAPVAFHHWVAVLKSASAFEAYRKAYRASMEPANVVEFLLLSPDFPRSVRYCLEHAEEQLARLGDPQQLGPARRRIGRAFAELQYREVDELLDDLHPFLDRMQHHVWRVADAVADEFFRHTPDGGQQSLTTS
jgi:uncharacterized alpha-E superfamily protein